MSQTLHFNTQNSTVPFCAIGEINVHLTVITILVMVEQSYFFHNLNAELLLPPVLNVLVFFI